jgi:hypothetical protein
MTTFTRSPLRAVSALAFTLQASAGSDGDTSAWKKEINDWTIEPYPVGEIN